jgi:hypothetical protein
LFTIYRAEFHAQFYPLAIGFAAAVASHAAHVDNSAVILGEVEKSRLPSSVIPSASRVIPLKLPLRFRGGIPRLRSG